MAILENNLPGQISGRLGDLVYYRSFGKTCVRRYSGKRSVAATVLQQQQRSRMRAACFFYRALIAAGLKGAWSKAAEGNLISGYNLFMHLNMQIFSGQGLITDFSRIRLVTGCLPLPDMLEVTRLSPTTIGVRWQLKARCNRKRLSDCLVLAFMKSERVYTVRLAETNGVCRSAREARVELPEDVATCPHCYCFFRSVQTGETSESRYFYLNV